MITYVYNCLKCEKEFEYDQRITDNPLKKHSQVEDSDCTGKLERIITPPHIVFKGENWEGNGKKGY